MVLTAAGVVFVLLFGGWCLHRVRREYNSGTGVLSSGTVVGVWLFYSVHGALTLHAAWQSLWPLPIPEAVALAIGVTLVVAGTGICVAGIMAFRSFTRMSGMKTGKLVRGGMYRCSRNPQSIGWVLLLFGVALLGKSVAALLLAALLALMIGVYLPVEERHLEAMFGDEYRAFKGNTARYLGLPRKRRSSS